MDERGWVENDEFLIAQSVISSNECTGLMPAACEDQEDKESYAEIYDAPCPEMKCEGKPKKRIKRLND